MIATSTPSSTSPSVASTPVPSPPPPPSPTPARKKSTPIGAIVGGVVGGLAVIAIALVAIFIAMRRKRQPPVNQSAEHEYHAPNEGQTDKHYSAYTSGPTSPVYSPTLASTSPEPGKSPAEVQYATFSPLNAQHVQPQPFNGHGGGYQAPMPVEMG